MSIVDFCVGVFGAGYPARVEFPIHALIFGVPAGVYVISPQGKLIGRIPIPEDLITNVAFGGPDRKTLYVTAGKTLYRFPVHVSGHAVYPPLDRK